MICMQQKTQKMREIDQAMQMAKIFGGQDPDNDHWKKVFALQDQSGELDKEIDRLKKRKHCLTSWAAAGSRASVADIMRWTGTTAGIAPSRPISC